MAIPEHICPRCETVLPADTTLCPGCGEDLAGWLHLVYAHAIYYNEALALARQGERESARESLLMSLRLRPNYAPSLSLAARLAAQEGRWGEAREYTARAKALAPNDPDLDALFVAIDEAEAEGQGAHDGGLQQVEREQPVAAQHSLAGRERIVLQAALFGALLGGVLSEAARRLLKRSAGRAG